MIIHIPTGKRFNNRKEAKIYFGSAYYYKIEKEKKDLLFINNIQSATNEYSTQILQKQCNRQLPFAFFAFSKISLIRLWLSLFFFA